MIIKIARILGYLAATKGAPLHKEAGVGSLAARAGRYALRGLKNFPGGAMQLAKGTRMALSKNPAVGQRGLEVAGRGWKRMKPMLGIGMGTGAAVLGASALNRKFFGGNSKPTPPAGMYNNNLASYMPPSIMGDY